MPRVIKVKMKPGCELPPREPSPMIRPHQTTPELLRDSANEIELNGTPSQIGMSPAALREVADQMERMRSCFDTMQRAIEGEGYDVLINIDGAEVSLRRRGDC